MPASLISISNVSLLSTVLLYNSALCCGRYVGSFRGLTLLGVVVVCVLRVVRLCGGVVSCRTM